MRPHLVTRLNQTPVFKSYMARLKTKNGHQIDFVSWWGWTRCPKYRRHSSEHHWEGLRDHSKWKQICTLTAYTICISTTIKLWKCQSSWFANASMTKQFLIQYNGPNCLELEAPIIGPRTFITGNLHFLMYLTPSTSNLPIQCTAMTQVWISNAT